MTFFNLQIWILSPFLGSCLFHIENICVNGNTSRKSKHLYRTHTTNEMQIFTWGTAARACLALFYAHQSSSLHSIRKPMISHSRHIFVCRANFSLNLHLKDLLLTLSWPPLIKQKFLHEIAFDERWCSKFLHHLFFALVSAINISVALEVRFGRLYLSMFLEMERWFK